MIFLRVSTIWSTCSTNSILPPLFDNLECSAYDSMIILSHPHGVSPYLYHLSFHQIQEDLYADFSNTFLNSLLYVEILPLNIQLQQTSWALQWGCHAQLGIALSVPWFRRFLQAEASAMTGVASIFPTLGSKSWAASCPISENSCFIYFSSF